MKYIIVGFIAFIHYTNALSQTYAPLGSGFNFDIRTLYYDSVSSTLYAGGGFWQTSDGVPMWRISQWNGIEWDSVGHGLDGTVFTITMYNGEIYAGGWFVSNFDSVGTIFPGLAKWNGTDWVRVDTDTIHHCCVLKLYTYNNELFVGGTFDTINGQPATGIARYNGTNWYYYPPLPNIGTFLFISAIVVYNNELYVAGNFNGGVGLQDIIKFDGTNWVSVGGGLSGAMSDVHDMRIFQNKLYIVGNLSVAAGDHGDGIAMWDGSSWSSVGAGLLPSTVHTLEVFNGELYVGGAISIAGGISVSNAAKWNGSNWFNIGGVFDNRVLCFAPNANDLFIGGAFITTNLDTMNCITKYTLPVGIDEIETTENLKIHISPNPTSNFIDINLTHGSINKIEIFDISGKVILEKDGDESLNCRIDVSSFANGIYTIKIISKANIFTEKLLIQK